MKCHACGAPAAYSLIIKRGFQRDGCNLLCGEHANACDDANAIVTGSAIRLFPKEVKR